MDDLICNQHRIPRDQWRYGFRSSRATGCGWIAVYNALRLMNFRTAPEQLIRFFQWQLPLLHGNCGTTLLAPAAFFRLHGFPVKLAFRRRRFNALARESDACVLFYRWRRGWKLGAHFVALKWDGERFLGYNTYRSSTGADVYGPDLEDFLRKKGYFGCVLTGLRRRK